jgi:hypothetical protein
MYTLKNGRGIRTTTTQKTHKGLLSTDEIVELMKIAQLNKTIKMGDLYKEYGASSKCMMEALCKFQLKQMHPFGQELVRSRAKQKIATTFPTRVY